MDKKAVITFVLVFIVATAGLTMTRLGAHTVAEIPVFESEENLMSDMAPIVVDESSAFYTVFQSKSRVNLLMLGVNRGMTDTIMLGSYDMDNQHVDIISIPRDTYYSRPAYANFAAHKINSVYNSEGVVGIATAVSEILYGMPVHYYAIVEYDDIKKVMDVIGGVEMDIPFHMRYIDTTKGDELYIDIPAGKQMITSANAVEFLRFRKTNPTYARQGYKGYPGGDLQRIEMQQQFVKAVLKECLKVGNLVDVAKVTLQNVESDITFRMAGKIAAKAMKGLSGEDITTYRLPGYDKMMHELSFFVARDEEVSDMLKTIYSIGDPGTEEYKGIRLNLIAEPFRDGAEGILENSENEGEAPEGGTGEAEGGAESTESNT